VIRFGVVLALFCGGAALADELPSNACVGSLGVGNACLTDDGTPGVCRVENGDLVCQPSVTAEQRSALPWIGAGLAFLALCAGIATRRAPVKSPT